MDADSLLQRAALLAELGRLEDLESLFGSHPGLLTDPRGLRTLAQGRLGAGRDASSLARRAVALDPDSEYGWRLLAGAASVRGDHDEALAAAAQARALNPDGHWPLILSAAVALTAGRLEDARAFADRAVRIGALEVEAHRINAEVLAAQHDFDGAERAYRTVVSLAPGDPEAAEELALFLRRRWRSGEALPLLARTLQANPTSSRGVHALANPFPGLDAVAHYGPWLAWDLSLLSLPLDAWLAFDLPGDGWVTLIQLVLVLLLVATPAARLVQRIRLRRLPVAASAAAVRARATPVQVLLTVTTLVVYTAGGALADTPNHERRTDLLACGVAVVVALALLLGLVARHGWAAVPNAARSLGARERRRAATAARGLRALRGPQHPVVAAGRRSTQSRERPNDPLLAPSVAEVSASAAPLGTRFARRLLGVPTPRTLAGPYREEGTPALARRARVAFTETVAFALPGLVALVGDMVAFKAPALRSHVLWVGIAQIPLWLAVCLVTGALQGMASWDVGFTPVGSYFGVEVLARSGRPAGRRLLAARVALRWLSLLPLAAGYWTTLPFGLRPWHDLLLGTRLVLVTVETPYGWRDPLSVNARPFSWGARP